MLTFPIIATIWSDLTFWTFWRKKVDWTCIFQGKGLGGPLTQKGWTKCTADKKKSKAFQKWINKFINCIQKLCWEQTGVSQPMKCNEWIKREDDTFFSLVYFHDRSSFFGLLLWSPSLASYSDLLLQSHCHSSHDRISHKTFERFDRLTFSNCAAIDSRCQPPLLFIHNFLFSF